MDEDEYWGEVSQQDARKRNLLIMIAKTIIANDFKLDRTYNQDEISDFFRFKKSDFAFFLNNFFTSDNAEIYYLNETASTEIVEIMSKHREVIGKVESAKAVYVKTFGRYREEMERNEGHNFDFEKLNLIYEKISPIIVILHWGLLPIIPDDLMINSDSIPEKDVVYFYDQYHMLEALLREVNGEGEEMTLTGDDSIDKDLSFSVYNRRWGHKDNYRVKRTIDGWDVRHISINGKCKKNGEGALLVNLHHDSIFFPEEGVKHAMEILWYESDEGEINIQELQVKLQQIADWISSVEKNLGESQPEWVNYY